MASAEEKLDALRKLGRAEIIMYDDGAISLYSLRHPITASHGKDWDDCLERLIRRQRKTRPS